MQNDQKNTLVSHLTELRNRLLQSIATVLVIMLCLMPFSNNLYQLVAEPLMQQLPENSTMIATEVASPFLTPFKLTLSAAIIVAIPFLLYQFWAFVAPGLYRHEKKLIMPLLVSSTLLFFLGMAFAFFVVFPLIFAFLTQAAPEGVAVMTDISSYLNFILKLFFAFGVAFEVPILTVILIWTGITTTESLKEKRPYIIVAAFVIGMLLTPPDIISQTLLALPVWCLFEIGIIASRWLPKQDESEGQTKEI